MKTTWSLSIVILYHSVIHSLSFILSRSDSSFTLLSPFCHFFHSFVSFSVIYLSLYLFALSFILPSPLSLHYTSLLCLSSFLPPSLFIPHCSLCLSLSFSLSVTLQSITSLLSLSLLSFPLSLPTLSLSSSLSLVKSMTLFEKHPVSPPLPPPFFFSIRLDH